MSDPISKEDLYGTSKPEAPAGDASVSQEGATPLTYEETPIIEPVAEPTPVHASVEPPPSLPPVGYLPKTSSKPHSFVSGLGKLIVFVLLFGVGIWLSSYVRQYMPKSVDVPFLTPTRTVVKPTPSVSTGLPTPSLQVVSDVWKSYDVLSGTSKKPIEGVKIQLPPDVLSLICDGVNCASQGTFLPGGTRFTVAARGAGQLLPDFRGTVISDVGGITFVTKPMILLGQQAMEFTGIFTGRTISGYAFSKMRGVMVPITSTLSLEINHFTPSGITADFDADDKLFNEILQKLSLPSAGLQDKGIPTATSSGN